MIPADTIIIAESIPLQSPAEPEVGDLLVYRRKVAALVASLNDPAMVTEAGEIIRGLIDRVTLTPIGGALHAELHGDLVTLAGFAEESANKNPGPDKGPGLLSLVAGTRNHRDFPIKINV